jgi:hypothetical protein
VNPASWTDAELDRIGAAEELELATLRRDGTPRDPVTTWVVRHDDDPYVRSWRGRDGGWYRAARARGEGHISAGGVVKEVAFADADHDLDDEIDVAYREKYGRYASYVGPMIGPEARETTLKLVPRS